MKENKFSRSIPEAFLNISEIVTLDISDNKLSGIIPSVIGKLSYLRILLLRGNRLNGTIPTQLCQLTNISLMDLSRNFFSGTLPHCFQHIVSNEILSFSALYLEKESQSHSKDIEVKFVTKYRLSSYKGNILRYMSSLDFLVKPNRCDPTWTWTITRSSWAKLVSQSVHRFHSKNILQLDWTRELGSFSQ